MAHGLRGAEWVVVADKHLVLQVQRLRYLYTVSPTTCQLLDVSLWVSTE
jgi:hypothetical protein